MIRHLYRMLLPVLVCSLWLAGPLPAWNEHYEALQRHFETVVKERFAGAFEGIDNVAEWEKERAVIKAKLLKVLGHDRPWPLQPPDVRITNRVERDDYVLECLVLETAPGLYITANFYIPRRGEIPYPLVIYQSGHSPRGYYGNKNAFKHHGAWFAARGISCLILDTIELGELPETHHGLYSYKWYDWFSRGYSPLAAELFQARRAIDYLVTRPEVDSKRIGATGISGGGVTTFFLTLIDDRIRAAAPVSGVCSTVGHIAGRLAVEHCDCMYPVNSAGLLFSEMGALAAPRPFLLCNALSDGLFPMPYFEQLVEKMREIYRVYEASDKLGTATVPGGHADSEAIRLPVYRFFLKEFLGLDTTLTEHGPVDTLKAEQLLCHRDGFPLDERLTRMHEEFMPRALYTPEQLTAEARKARLEELTRTLRSEVFPFFPEKGVSFETKWGGQSGMWKRTMGTVSFRSFAGLRVEGIYTVPEHLEQERRLAAVLVIRDKRRPSWWPDINRQEGYDWGERAVLIIEPLDNDRRAIDDSLAHQMERQAMIAGQSFDGIRVYEILRSLEFLRSMPEVDPQRITIAGSGAFAVNGLYGALLDGRVSRVVLESPTASHIEGPHYLGVLIHTDIPEVACLMSDKVRLYGTVPLQITDALRNAAPGNACLKKSLADCLE
jgi:cephalosporin-C deacetylase-like acetyl esterase